MILEFLCVLVNPRQEIVQSLFLDSWDEFIAALLVIIIQPIFLLLSQQRGLDQFAAHWDKAQ